MSAYLTTLLAFAGLAAGWVAVQRAWRRSFPARPGADPDALACRPGCGGCESAESLGNPTARARPARAKERS